MACASPCQPDREQRQLPRQCQGGHQRATSTPTWRSAASAAQQRHQRPGRGRRLPGHQRQPGQQSPGLGGSNSNIVYWVTGNVYVPTGAALRVAAGTVVKFTFASLLMQGHAASQRQRCPACSPVTARPAVRHDRSCGPGTTGARDAVAHAVVFGPPATAWTR